MSSSYKRTFQDPELSKYFGPLRMVLQYFFNKHIVYKNILAQNHPILRTLKEYCSASARTSLSPFSAAACFTMFISENHMTDISRLFKKLGFLLLTILINCVPLKPYQI